MTRTDTRNGENGAVVSRVDLVFLWKRPVILDALTSDGGVRK